MRLKRISVIMLLLSSSGPIPLLAEEWIGLDDSEPTILGLVIGSIESNDQSLGVNILLPLSRKTRFIGSYSSSRYADDEIRFNSLLYQSALNIEINDGFSLELGYEFEGSHDELEKQAYEIALDFIQQDWFFEMSHQSGELLIFTRDDIRDDLSRIIPAQFSSDLNSSGVSIGWQGARWYWQASHRSYHYEQNLSRLSTSFFIQFLVKQQALAQSSLLVSQTDSIEIGYGDDFDIYALSYSEDRSAIDSSRSETLGLAWYHWTGGMLDLLFDIAIPVESQQHTLSLGLQWTL